MSDRRYKTARWQRLRKAVLTNFNYTCQLQGPRCTLVATTVHHRVPSSQRPDLFWQPENLTASCVACNYSDGGRIASENKRATIVRLQELVIQQQQEIDRLIEQVMHLEDAARAKRVPAIH